MPFLWYEGYVDFTTLPEWAEINKSLHPTQVQSELIRARYRVQLRKDIKKTIRKLKSLDKSLNKGKKPARKLKTKPKRKNRSNQHELH